MPEEKAESRPRRKRWIVLLVTVVALLLLGHVSNVISLRASERAVLFWYLKNFPEGRTLRYSEDGETSTFHYCLLDETRTPFKVLSAEEYKKNPYPSCEVQPAQPLCPFVATARLDHIEGMLGGAGGRAYVLNFFGACWVLWHQTDWVS